MPYAIRKVRNKNCWMVKNVQTGQVKARCTSLKNAKAQVRLLYGVDSGNWFPTRNLSPKSKRRSLSPRSSRKSRKSRSPRSKRSPRSSRR